MFGFWRRTLERTFKACDGLCAGADTRVYTVNIHQAAWHACVTLRHQVAASASSRCQGTCKSVAWLWEACTEDWSCGMVSTASLLVGSTASVTAPPLPPCCCCAMRLALATLCFSLLADCEAKPLLQTKLVGDARRSAFRCDCRSCSCQEKHKQAEGVCWLTTQLDEMNCLLTRICSA